jgi:hypothetical protein
MSATRTLHNLGQSLLRYNITRNVLRTGVLGRYIDELAIIGLTSSPTIFDHAIKNSKDYDDPITTRSNTNWRKESRERSSCSSWHRTTSPMTSFREAPERGMAAISWALFLSYVAEIRTVSGLIPLPLCRNPPMRPIACILNPNTSRRA